MNFKCGHNSIVIDGNTIGFDGYTFQGEISRGSNGVVVGAIEHSLNRPVAIKFWYANKSDERNKLEQGRNEATKIASIPHKNIVTVFSAGIKENCFYLVMELLPGKSLREVLTNKFPSLVFRTKIWSQIVTALRHAHKNSVYHGDLHDRNVIICDDDVKIIDFGTSCFYSDNKDKEANESSFILKLSRNMFPEIEIILRKCNELILRKPRLVLFYCDSWVKLISEFDLLEIYTNKDLSDDHLVISTIYGIALSCAKCPYIDLNYIIKKLYNYGLSSKYVNLFLNQSFIYCTLIAYEENEAGIDAGNDSISSESKRTERLEKIRGEVSELYDFTYGVSALEIDSLLYT